MFPRWLTFLMLMVFSYLIFQTSGREAAVKMQPPSPITTEQGLELGPALRAATNTERWKRALNPEYANNYQCDLPSSSEASPLIWRMVEEAAGTGDPARCAEGIRVSITLWGTNGTASLMGEHDITLGARSIAAGVDAALMGIRIGGKRTVILGPEALARAGKTTLPKGFAPTMTGKKLLVLTLTRIS